MCTMVTSSNKVTDIILLYLFLLCRLTGAAIRPESTLQVFLCTLVAAMVARMVCSF